jgi:hypothetical protein
MRDPDEDFVEAGENGQSAFQARTASSIPAATRARCQYPHFLGTGDSSANAIDAA